MTDPKQIPHLIKLLDDESSDIREAVAKKLEAFGPTLKEELKKLTLSLNPTQEEYINEILREHKRVWLKHIWPNWLSLIDEREDLLENYKKMESALAFFSKFLNESDSDLQLKNLLDELACAYKEKFKNSDPVRLAKFLFKEKKLCGDEEDYYNPQNSNLVYVITKKKGIPISLCAVYMLVGLRLGIRIEGCHFPGHFLARIDLDGRKVFVDCFSGGQIVDQKDLLNMRGDVFEGMENVLNEIADARTIVRRFLANLIRSYQAQTDKDNSELMIKLFRDMDAHISDSEILNLTPEDIIDYGKSNFESGQCVNHVRYGYRGIIVEVDRECEATDDWYYGNQTQPNCHQPWYHVLVHGSDQVTYVAESNLVKDSSKEKMTHSLLSYFFTKDKKGDYIRNDNPWPETDF
ncbi:MAG: heat shock protein HspQ [Candidatus Omnitrophica bacterium]|nr:heat shock protein HspQ [Candidatus Omnitrophota bacterium]